MARIPGPAAVLLAGALALAGCDATTPEQHLDNARARLSEGEVRTAAIELKNALQKAPDLAPARLLLGETHSRLGDHPAALKEFERALDLGLDNERVQVGRLDSKVRLGRFEEVIGELEGRTDLSPRLAVVLGDAYLDAGDVAAARRMYQQGRSLAAGSLGLGTIAWQEGDLPRAADLLQRAVAGDPENAEAWLRKGEFELSRQALGAAEEAFRAAAGLPAGTARLAGQVGLARVNLLREDLDVAAGHVARVLQLAPDFPLGHYLDGLIRFAQQDIDGAEAAIREVQRLLPEHGPSLYLMGVIKYRQGQTAQAEYNLQRLLAQESGNEPAAKVLASIGFERGAHERVIDLLTPFAADTSDPQLLAMLGAAQLRAGRPAEAARSLDRAVALAPDRAPFRNQLALSLLASGDSLRAEAELRGAIDVDGEQFQSDYLLAMLKLRERDWNAAADTIATLIAKSPDSPLGYNLRGALALATGDAAAARTAFETALAKAPAFLPAVHNLARLAEQAGDRPRAAAHYRAFLDENPGNEDALMALAELALRTDDGEAATGYLEQAVADNAGSVRARLGLARLQLAAGQLQRASELVDEALGRAPDQAQLLLLRAEIDLRQGDVEGARSVAAQLQSRVGRAGGDAALALGLGQLQIRLGSLALARANLERAAEQTDGSSLPLLLARAQLDLAEGRLADARAHLTSIPNAAGGDQARLLEAELLLAEGRRDEALALLERLAQADLRNAVLRLATLELHDGDTAAAARRLEAWLAAHPGDVAVELLLADAWLSADPDRALARYEALADSGNPLVLNNLAWLYLQKGDPRALATARRAAEAAPDSPEVLDTLGWVLLQQSDEKQEAVRVLRRSAQLMPDNPSVQYHLGIALREIGDMEGARSALTRAAAADDFPELEETRAALSALARS